MSGALAIQSRQPFVVSDNDGSDNDSDYGNYRPEYENPKAKPVLADCDPVLRWAFATVSTEVANKWRPGTRLDDVETNRDFFKNPRNEEYVSRRLLEEFKQRSSKNGSAVSKKKSKEIKKQIANHVDEIFGTITDLVLELIRESSRKDDTPEASPQAQRKRVNRILRLIKRRATCYELLGVKQNAEEREIKVAWKDLVAGLHPDKNKDSDAQECAQAVNAARDVLCNPEKRKKYDYFLKNTPPPKAEDSFGEELGPNAFDEDDSDDAPEEDDEEDGEEDDEKNYEQPTKQIEMVHNVMSSRIKAFFEDLEGPVNFSKLNSIEKLNKKIMKDNQKCSRAVLTVYQVPRQRLLFYQYAQRRIPIGFETGLFDPPKVQKEMHWLQEHFTKTREKGLYQWPAAWTHLLMDPLHHKLESLGLAKEQQSFPKTDGSEVPSDEDEDEAIDEEMEDAQPQNTSRQIQPLRPGFTILGDPILGYLPIQRRSKVMAGEAIILGFKIFVKVDDVNPIKVTMGSEIGDAAALAYHQLPEDQKNDVGKNAAKYTTMAATEFVNIIGVTWVPGSSRSDRLPITYVWAKTLTDSKKPHIMTRTTFRQWIGTSVADKHIDSWLVKKGITPEWAAMGFLTDPANDSKYLRLTYPPPRQASHYNLRPRIQNGGFQALPAPQREDGGFQALPAPRREDGDIQELSRKFDQLVELFIKGQEEAHEDRKQQREIMSRLLPAP